MPDGLCSCLYSKHDTGRLIFFPHHKSNSSFYNNQAKKIIIHLKSVRKYYRNKVKTCTFALDKLTDMADMSDKNLQTDEENMSSP